MLKPIIKLPLSLEAWDTAAFNDVFKNEVSQLDRHLLPLQKALTHSSYVSDEAINPVILSYSANQHHLHIRCTVFYTGIIAGCSCSDDPTPQDTQQESCDLALKINRDDAITQIDLLLD